MISQSAKNTEATMKGFRVGSSFYRHTKRENYDIPLFREVLAG